MRCSLDRKVSDECEKRRSAADGGFTYDSRVAPLLRQILIVNPAIGLFQPCPQRSVWLPVQVLLNEGVVAVAAVYTFGSGQIVVALQFDPGKLFRQVNELIDGNRLAGAEIYRFENLRVQDHVDALDAIVDEHEAAGLISGAPNFNFVLSGNFRLDHFPANCRW